MIDGKFKIELADQEREMVANFGFIEAIEQGTIKRPVVALLEEALSGRFNISDIVTVIHLGLRANRDTRLERSAIGDEIMKRGAVKFLQTYIEMLTYAISGDTELKAESADDKKK